MPPQVTKLELVKRMLGDVMFLGRVCTPNMFTLRSASFHYEMADAYMDRKQEKINVVAPRGHAKSSLWACLFVLHHLAENMYYKRKSFVVLVSKTEGHAARLLDTLKNVLEYSPGFKQFFGYHGEQVSRAWTRTEVVLDTGDVVMAKGTGQQVVGLKVGDQRPTFIILDDPEDVNNTKTVEAMEMNLKWLFTQLVPTRDAQRGRIAVIGTPQHQRCLVETLKKADGWHSYHYKAIQDDGTSVLWPEQWPLEKLLAEKASAESIGRVSMFYREYQCQIIGDEDQLFREDDIQYWDGDIIYNTEGEAFLRISELNGQKIADPDLTPVNVFSGVDPASSVAQSADYSVIMNAAVDEKDNRYVLPYFRKHVKPMDLSQAIIDNYHRYHPNKTQIESVGYQEMLRDYLRRQDEFIPGLEIKNNPRSNKSTRLETMEPWFRGHKVFIKKGMSDLVDELLMYPRGKHDDLLDGLFYAFKGMYKPYHTKGNFSTEGEHSLHHTNFHRRRKKSWMTA